MELEDAVSMGKNVSAVHDRDGNRFYLMRDGSGEGVMRSYSVFPGVELLFHDFHMDHCISYFHPDVPIFCVDHCREGRLEWEMGDGSCLYMEAGDLQLNSRSQHEGRFQFPLRHYHGLTVAIMPDEAQEALTDALDGYPVNLWDLRERFCGSEKPVIFKAEEGIERILSELYTVREDIRAPFFKLKVLELVLLLSTLGIPGEVGARPYFTKTQVEKAKAIMSLLTAEPHRHYTLEELSGRFDFPMTAMKNCFKGVYGSSIYSYMKTYRMNAAAVRLSRTGESVTAIAQQLGYDNASKFAAAFRAVIGMTPSEYRKSAV